MIYLLAISMLYICISRPSSLSTPYIFLFLNKTNQLKIFTQYTRINYWYSTTNSKHIYAIFQHNIIQSKLNFYANLIHCQTKNWKTYRTNNNIINSFAYFYSFAKIYIFLLLFVKLKPLRIRKYCTQFFFSGIHKHKHQFDAPRTYNNNNGITIFSNLLQILFMMRICWRVLGSNLKTKCDVSHKNLMWHSIRMFPSITAVNWSKCIVIWL